MTRFRRQRGLSLIELMIAVSLGAFLLIGLVQIFGASRQAYQTSVGLSRIQEGGRFGMEFLQRDLRMAGHLGWANDVARKYAATFPAANGAIRITQFDNLMARDNNPADQFNNGAELASAAFPFRFDMAIQGFEANNSAPGETVALAGRSPGTPADWTPALDPGFFADIAPKPLRGSDVLVMRFFAQDGIPVSFDRDNNRITYLQASDEGFMQPGRFYGIANYGAAAVFQAPPVVSGTAITILAGGGTSNERLFAAASEQLHGNVMLYPANIFAYYVGLGASGVPSLFRASFQGNAWNSEELVEGMEMLQITYGRDGLSQVAAGGGTQPCGVGGNCFPDGSIDQYQTADALVAGLTTEIDRAARWRTVGAVRIGVLMRSPERTGTPDRQEAVAAIGQLQVGRTIIDLPEGEGLLRVPYESTVALRNRLYGN